MSNVREERKDLAVKHDGASIALRVQGRRVTHIRPQDFRDAGCLVHDLETFWRKPFSKSNARRAKNHEVNKT
jgi:hypothetical protein